jgi:hypothetical protein
MGLLFRPKYCSFSCQRQREKMAREIERLGERTGQFYFL